MKHHLENCLRIKVTGACNRKCSFCHQEGKMNEIQEINYTDELKYIIDDLHDNLHLKTIAFTGGEPLKHHDLLSLSNSIYYNTKINKISLTTNGTIEKDISFWKDLSKYGLYKVNISMPDILDNIIISNQNEHIDKIFNNQKKLITMLLDLNLEVKINIVVFNDKLYTGNIISKLIEFKNGYNLDLVLLPNLLNQETFDYSQNVIKNICEELNLTISNQKQGLGTSRSEDIYMNPNGDKISIKNTKKKGNPFYLKSMCGSCDKKSICQEGFYGIRLEQSKDNYLIRLCIYKDDDSVLMKYNDFKDSQNYKEIFSNWCNN